MDVIHSKTLKCPSIIPLFPIYDPFHRRHVTITNVMHVYVDGPTQRYKTGCIYSLLWSWLMNEMNDVKSESWKNESIGASIQVVHNCYKNPYQAGGRLIDCQTKFAVGRIQNNSHYSYFAAATYIAKPTACKQLSFLLSSSHHHFLFDNKEEIL